MASKTHNGYEYLPGVAGKHLFRVRESYLAHAVACLVETRRYEAVKLDLVLRGLALLPEHSGKRRPGTVLRFDGRLNYEDLHDLVRDPRRYSTDLPENEDDDPVVREKKRKWVGEQLQVLEELKLVQRLTDPYGRRPELIVLSDKGNGKPFDDPGANALKKGNSYITVLAPVVTSEHFRSWSAPELVAFLCCMVADRYAANDQERRTGRRPPAGGAEWYRQAEWFNNENGYRPTGHVVLPFSTKTIRRGLQALAVGPLLDVRNTARASDGRRFDRSRNVYTNRFDELASAAKGIDLTAVLGGRRAS